MSLREELALEYKNNYIRTETLSRVNEYCIKLTLSVINEDYCIKKELLKYSKEDHVEKLISEELLTIHTSFKKAREVYIKELTIYSIYLKDKDLKYRSN